MKIKTAEFVISNTDIAKCPTPQLPEYAFIGRSNVGKSSLINALTQRKSLAKVSGKPGKTQTINHFLINDDWYLVDLPGYGYAKTSKKNRSAFASIIRTYILNRQNLVALFVLVDCRHDPQPNDLAFMRWLAENEIPFVIVFTKGDKLPEPKLNTQIKRYTHELKKEWDPTPPMIITSATARTGLNELLLYVEQNNPLFLHYLAQQ